ncbi:calcium-binding protein [Microcoleus sp. S28C3]|uniref:calcium-binding protein n=1 Tax=Microcoleus sp. S28C3 TaxID=3055414 RepID=UPI002FCFD4E3
MALQTDPSGVPRLIGENTSEYSDLRFGSVGISSGGVLMLGGDDTVDGAQTNDLIFGNEGEDILRGNFGNDSLLGGKGKDAILGGDGNDSINGGQDGDVIFGDGGNDILVGGKGNDFLVSGSGNDTLVGGVGRDFLAGFDDNNYLKIGGSNLYVLQAEPGVTDVNNADIIVNFRPAFDKIGLADGLTINDVVLESLTNVSITVQFEFPQAAGSFIPPDQLRPLSAVTSGTAIKLRNSGEFIGFVEAVTPAQLQNSILNSIISVQGF